MAEILTPVGASATDAGCRASCSSLPTTSYRIPDFLAAAEQARPRGRPSRPRSRARWSVSIPRAPDPRLRGPRRPAPRRRRFCRPSIPSTRWSAWTSARPSPRRRSARASGCRTTRSRRSTAAGEQGANAGAAGEGRSPGAGVPALPSSPTTREAGPRSFVPVRAEADVPRRQPRRHPRRRPGPSSSRPGGGSGRILGDSGGRRRGAEAAAARSSSRTSSRASRSRSRGS